MPFLGLGSTGAQILPGVPLGALDVACPAIAGAALTFRKGGRRSATGFLMRAFDVRRVGNPVWLIPTFFLMPLVMVLSFAVMRAQGVPIPLPRPGMAGTLGLSLVCFVGALGEELGWSGYATEPLQNRFGALGASLVIGSFGILWHIVPLLEVRRSATYVAWWALGNGIAVRVLIVWIYDNTGRSVFAASVFHAMVNITWQLFPIDGSYFDPRITSPIVAAFAALTLVPWGPHSLSGRRR